MKHLDVRGPVFCWGWGRDAYRNPGPAEEVRWMGGLYRPLRGSAAGEGGIDDA